MRKLFILLFCLFTWGDCPVFAGNEPTYYTKFYSHHRLSDFKFNDKASSIKVWSDIPSNDSVYVNWSDVETME